MAGASAALAAGPASSAVTAIPAASATTSANLFAVVSPGQAWGVFPSIHEAYGHASTIRHSGALYTSHVRCSQAFADQLQQGALKSFVEIDGWAFTSSETEARGIDLVRRAVDRAGARNQLHRNHVATARQRVEAFDAASSDVQFYTSHTASRGTPAQITAVYDNHDAAQQHVIQAGPGASAQKCSAALANELQDHLQNCTSLPGIITQTSRHTTAAEHASRLAHDPLYRLASGISKPANAITSTRQTARTIAYDRKDGWIYGCGTDDEDAIANAAWSNPYRDGRDLLTMTASPVLAARVGKKGLECAGFWQPVRGTARHESELPSTSRPPTFG